MPVAVSYKDEIECAADMIVLSIEEDRYLWSTRRNGEWVGVYQHLNNSAKVIADIHCVKFETAASALLERIIDILIDEQDFNSES